MTPNPSFQPPPAQPPKPSSSNKTVIIILAVAAGLFFLCVCSGILAAIAIPNFVKYQARAKQGECKANLKALYVAQKSLLAEKGDFGDSASETGFTISGASRYTYFAGPDFVVAPTQPGALAVEESQLPPLAGDALPGVEGECPECTFVAACASNVDSDETLDVWSISTSAREAPTGQPIAPGEVFHDVDDLGD